MLKQFPLLRSVIKAHKRKILLSVCVLFAQAVIILALPLPMRFALDTIVKNTPGINLTNTLLIATGLILLLGFLASALEYAEERVGLNLINSVVTFIREKLIEQTFTRKQSFIDGKRKVDVSGRLLSDAQNLEAFFVSGIVVLVRSLPSLVFIVGAMLYLNLYFAAIILALLPVFYFIITYLAKEVRIAEKTVRRVQNSYEQDLLQALYSLSLIKSLTSEKATAQAMMGRQQELNKSSVVAKHYTALFNSAFSLSRHVLRAVVIFAGGYAIINGYLTLGTLFVFVSYLESMNRPIAEISNFTTRYGKAMASLERVEEYYQELQGHPETGGALKTPARWKTLGLRNITFGYGSNAPLFDRLNFEFKTHELVAMVGSSGSGKSSFIRLLNRLQTPVQGDLFLDEAALSSLELKSLRQSVCVISQDPFFIVASIRDNLTMALDFIPSDEEIMTALQLVNARQFVEEMPAKLDTLIGESGVQISGGQSKRLSLARAFLRRDQAQIFVFDEPTSGLDPLSAAHVMTSIKNLSREKNLVLYSTHRLEEFKMADTVLFFSSGTNPFLSSHHELVATNSYYQQLIAEDGEGRNEKIH